MGNVRQHTFQTTHRNQSGFTLVELMVVVALVAILAMLATPSWRTLQVRNNIRALVNDYTLSVYFAKSEAVRQNAPVTVCPSSNGATCTNSGLESGWVVFVGLPDAANPPLLQDTPARPRVQTSFADNALASQAVTFLPNGQPAATFAGNTLRVCPVDAELNALSRHVILNRAARITVTSPNTCN
jgi:type IV fimbrial biogenesis protein FimT